MWSLISGKWSGFLLRANSFQAYWNKTETIGFSFVFGTPEIWCFPDYHHVHDPRWCSCRMSFIATYIKRVTLTLARSTVLARRVRSFQHYYSCPELATALRNMSSLRKLNLWDSSDVSILDGCTFKLDSFYLLLSLRRTTSKISKQPAKSNGRNCVGGHKPLIPFDEPTQSDSR